MTEVSKSEHHSLRTLHTANLPMRGEIVRHEVEVRPQPFITISRQIGVGLPSLPQTLTKALTERTSSDRPGWSAWDRELIEKVAAEYNLSVHTIEQLEHSGYSWLDTFVSGLGGLPDDYAIVHRVRDGVRTLAAQGQAVLVGHGAVFITSDMPGGTHIRLVAPLRHRIQNFARTLQISIPDATEKLDQAERVWAGYLKRFWPTKSLTSEMFTATLNSALMSEEQIVRCIVTLATPAPADVRDRR